MTAEGLTRRVLLERASVASAAVLTAGPLADVAVAAHRHRRVPPHVFETLGTELEYYRSDPTHLEGRLKVCAAVGYATIQTYVPWNVHESTRGVLDFAGHTRPVILSDHADEYQIETPDQEISGGGAPARIVANTDLLGFVRACGRHGLKVILRPGPFISDEWRNGGLPDWLATAYPNMFMRGPHGTTLEPGFPFSPPAGSVTGGGPLFYFAGPSYASEDYLREARRWMTEFARAVRTLQRSHGGPVISMQADDEICFYYRFGPFEVDYHPSMVARFGANPPTDWPAQHGSPAALRPALRWQRFKAHQLAVFLADMRRALRAGGATVPITHEEELQLTPPANLAQIASAVDVLHPEFYLDPSAFTVPTIELCAAAVRGAQRQRKDVYAAEMSAGDTFVRHVLTGEGISGFLGFSYTQGIDDGDVENMTEFDRAVRFAGSRLARANRVADTAIVWPPEYLYAPYDSDRYGFQRDVRGAIERDIPALATLLIRSGLSFDLLDTDAAQPRDYDRYKSIWLACADVLPRSCQQALVRYVRRGGKLVCWPAPPTLDENYAPCTILRDTLYNQHRTTRYPGDDQTITVLGSPVRVWRGVQTFKLSPGVSAIARRGKEACGYSRRIGRGRAILLGTWPAADSVPGRIGDALEVQDVPDSGGQGAAAALALRMATSRYGAGAARALDTSPPPDAGPPQKVIVFDYTNQRRGGEVIAGGTVAYWDGQNVAPLGDINLGPTTPVIGTSRPEVTRPPYRPVTAAHTRMARALHGHRATCAVSDNRAQVRVLRARDSGAATVSVVNRYDTDIEVAITVSHEGSNVRLPRAGKMKLPAHEALLLPLDYDLAPNLTIEQATVQVLGAKVARRILTLQVVSPGGGELVMHLPSRLTGATIDGRRAHAARRKDIRLAVPAGTRRVQLHWG
jgi:hypothetical protein